MKLTKGKLSKLFHKKKQTMRRYKNQRKYRSASKTFRQRKPLNLHRSSMKKMVVPRKIEWIGGTEPDEKVPLVVKPASDEETTDPIMEPVSEPVAEQAVEPVPEQVAEEPIPEPVSEPAMEPVSEPIPEPVAEEPVSEPVTEKAIEPIAEEPIAEPLDKPVEEPIVAENVKPESSSVQPSVADALNLIADKIATAVVMKMRENPANGSSSNQDADIAVPLAVNAVVRQTQLAPE
jgi:outer membrane biosynthesis protein TonB